MWPYKWVLSFHITDCFYLLKKSVPLCRIVRNILAYAIISFPYAQSIKNELTSLSSKFVTESASSPSVVFYSFFPSRRNKSIHVTGSLLPDYSQIYLLVVLILQGYSSFHHLTHILHSKTQLYGQYKN